MEEGQQSGEGRCAIRNNWKDAYTKVSEMHLAIRVMVEHLPHLSKLKVLEDIKEHLMHAATGKDHLQTKTAMAMFGILGTVIFGLLAIIVYLLSSGHVKIPGMTS